MNITQQTIEKLKKLYHIGFYSTTEPMARNTSAEKADTLVIAADIETNSFLNIRVKTPAKKEVTFDWVVTQVEKYLQPDTAYKNLCQKFAKIIKGKNLGTDAYATSYGIGVFAAINIDGCVDAAKQAISNELEAHGIKHTCEASDAGWVFRYKISKSAENIQAIERM